MQKFNSIVSLLSRWLNIIALYILFLLLWLVTVDVVLRYVFNRPLVWGFEVDCIMLAALVLFGLGYTGIVRGHIRIELIVSRLPQKAQRVLDIFSCLISSVIFALIAWRGAVSAIEARHLGEITEVLRIPMVYPKLFVTVGMGVLSLVFILQMLEAIKAGEGR